MTTSDFELLYGNDTKMDVATLSAAILFTAGPSQKVVSIDGQTGVVTLTDINLEQVDNTSDLDKPISTAVQEALDNIASISDVLTFGNTTVFVPTLDYEPSTKKYADDLVSAINHDDLSGFVPNEHIDWTQSSMGTIHATNYNAYEHPSFVPHSASVDTDPLLGATIISDIDMNISNNAEGHVTSAAMHVDTRELTLADLNYTGATDADNYASFGVQVDSGTVEDVLSEEDINLISGDNITISITGKDITINASDLPIALDAVLGGVKSGTEISVDSGSGEMSIVGLGGTGATGVATLVNGVIPVAQLPSAYGGIVEYADYATMVANGDGLAQDLDALYVTIDDDKQWRWTGTTYVDITSSGVDTIAGQSGVVTLADIGLDNVDNTADTAKPVSTVQQTALDGKVDENADIAAGTNTKITYDIKGLVTSGSAATTADIADSLDARYVTDAQLTDIGNISGFDSANYSETGQDPNYVNVVVGNDVLRDLDTLTLVTDTNKIVTEDDIGSFGAGDMLESEYDTGGAYTHSVDSADTVLGFTVESNVPAGAVFGYNPADPGTDGTDGADGLLEDSDKFKLDGISAGANINTVEVDSVNTFTAAQRGSIVEIGASWGDATINFESSNRFRIVTSKDFIVNAPENAVAGQGGLIYIIQDATGSRNVTWNAAFKFIDSDSPIGGSPNDIQIYTYEVYDANNIIMAYAGTI